MRETAFPLVRLAMAARRMSPVKSVGSCSIALESVESWSGRLLQEPLDLEDLEGAEFERGDILFGKLRPYLAKVWVADRTGNYIGDFIRLRPFSNFNPRFLGYVLRSREVIEAASAESLGTKMPRTEWERLRQLRIPAPSLEEQRQVVDYLDRETAEIDAFINDLHDLKVLASEHFSSLRSETLRQPSSVGKETDSHSVPLTRALPHRVDYRGATPTKVDDGIQLVTARNIRPGWIDYESSQEFVSPKDYSQVMSRGLPIIGDILFTMEAPLGNAALVDRTDVALAQRVIKFTPTLGVDSRFMCHVMNSNEFQHQLRELATGSTALGLKASKLHQLRVLIPDAPTQKRAVRILDDAWSSLVRLQDLVDEAKKLALERRSSLISAAVTGQIDVTAQRKSAAEQLQDELEVHP